MPEEGRVVLGDDEAHHLARVLRIERGAVVELFDGVRSASRLAEVVAIRGREVELGLVGEAIGGPDPTVELTLMTAVPKGERFDWLVEKAVELGVERLQPISCRRSVVDPRAGKLERVRRRVIEASKQCGRNRIMEVLDTAAWEVAVASTAGAPRLVAHPDGVPFDRWPNAEGAPAPVLAVGAEGGFAPEEVELAERAGWRAVSLGRYIMRIETAAIAGAALVMAKYGGTAR